VNGHGQPRLMSASGSEERLGDTFGPACRFLACPSLRQSWCNLSIRTFQATPRYQACVMQLSELRRRRRSSVNRQKSECHSPSGREHPRPYCPVAALNLAASSAGIRPRSFTSMPCALAHSRTSVLSTPLAGVLRLPRDGRGMPPPARRAAFT
jgi:hypothetical protein